MCDLKAAKAKFCGVAHRRAGSGAQALRKADALMRLLCVLIAASVASDLEPGFVYDNSIPAADTARCFSCMSRLYEAIWPVLSHIYKRPRNFTDACDDESLDPALVPVVNCPTICVAMVEEPNIGGVRVRGYIRGCMNDVLIGGFNQTIVGWYRWMHRDSCRPYRKKELFMLPGKDPDESQIEVCTCYADHCNGVSASSAHSLLFVCLLPLLLLLRLP